MMTILGVTLKGIFRDRVFQGIMISTLIFLVIPFISTLSMRQVTELAMTLSLSLISFILLLLSVFLGGTSIWRDIERRYTYSVLGLPLTRGRYILGKFGGTALFLLLTSVVLGVASYLDVSYASSVYRPDRPVVWANMVLCIIFDVMKYIMLVAFAFLFSSVSTSFFLPIFGTIATFLVGGVTQQVYDYVHSLGGEHLTPFVKHVATALYYILPNFSAFDLKVNAIYGIPPSIPGMLYTVCYFIVYTIMILAISMVIFSRREMR